MCEALLELMHDEIEQAKELSRQQGLDQGLEQGLAQGSQQGLQQVVPALINAYKKLNYSVSEILNNLVSELNISESTAQKYVAKYM